MGDISELRGLVLVGTFLTTTILLISWIPSEFYSSDETYKQITPSDFNVIDIVQYENTHNFTFGNYGEQWGKEDFGHTMHISFVKAVFPYWGYVMNKHSWGFLNWNIHKMEWINSDGVTRGETLEEIEIVWDHDENNVSAYKVECSHFYMNAWFAYNMTEYGSFPEAWDDDEAKVLFAIDFDQTGSVWNIWSLISGLLFFDLPDTNFYITALISVPIWIAIIYISYILMLRAIGAIFGGGA